MKKISLLSSLLMLSFSMIAGTTWNLQGTSFTVDTLFHAKVGPGTTQTSLIAKGNLELEIYYTTTDLTNEYLEMRTVKANNKIYSMATVPNMARSNTKTGENYFVGINGDFYNMSNGSSLGTNVINSEIYNIGNNTDWIEWSVDANKKQHIGKIMFSGVVKRANGSSLAITNVNASRNTNNLILYSQRFGSSTSTNQPIWHRSRAKTY